MDSTLRQLLKEKDSTVLSVTPEATVTECVMKMNDYSIGAILVLDGENLEGIFTERDVLVKIVGASRDPKTTKVKEVMSTNLVSVSPETTVRSAMCIVTEKRFRHLPVIEDKKLLGMISNGDLTRWVTKNQEIKIKDLEGYIQGSY